MTAGRPGAHPIPARPKPPCPPAGSPSHASDPSAPGARERIAGEALGAGALALSEATEPVHGESGIRRSLRPRSAVEAHSWPMQASARRAEGRERRDGRAAASGEGECPSCKAKPKHQAEAALTRKKARRGTRPLLLPLLQRGGHRRPVSPPETASPQVPHQPHELLPHRNASNAFRPPLEKTHAQAPRPS